MTLLGIPNSYAYLPYSFRTNMELRWSGHAMFAWMATRLGVASWGTPPLIENWQTHTPDTMNGACSNWQFNGSPITIREAAIGTADLSAESLDVRYSGLYSDNVNDDGGAMPMTFYRIKEGIERFYITDINNPAASSTAQSELVVMFDAWANSGLLAAFYEGESGTVLFNHIPGGSNVLYMDGHVEFLRYGTEMPMGKDGPNSDISTILSYAMADYCGQG